jgi:hypothetical protein
VSETPSLDHIELHSNIPFWRGTVSTKSSSGSNSLGLYSERIKASFSQAFANCRPARSLTLTPSGGCLDRRSTRPAPAHSPGQFFSPVLLIQSRANLSEIRVLFEPDFPSCQDPKANRPSWRTRNYTKYDFLDSSDSRRFFMETRALVPGPRSLGESSRAHYRLVNIGKRVCWLWLRILREGRLGRVFVDVFVQVTTFWSS